MDRKKALIWGIAAVAAVIGIALLFQPAGGGVRDVSPARSAELIDEGIRVIDVRTPAEFELSHMPGAQNVPMDELGAAAAGWDTSEPLLVYCTTGARSTFAVQYLDEQGFETVYHFVAGIVAWDGELERGSEVAPMPADVKPPGSPVMYEFSTDW